MLRVYRVGMMFAVSPFLKDLPRNGLHVLVEGGGLGFQRSLNGLTDTEPKVFERNGQLSGPHIGTQRMKRYFSFGEGMQPLRELGARLAPAADNLTQVNPFCTGRFGNGFALT